MACRSGGRRSRGRKRICLISSTAISTLFIISLLVIPNLCVFAASNNTTTAFPATCDDEVRVVSSDSGGRKLLQMNTICSKNDIAIYQGPSSPLPSGIPAFTVEILNMCVSDCYITNIHVSCGWFSSVHLVNPRVFRRVDYDDCVVNNGEVLSPGQSLSFQYANSFQYPLSVSSVDCS